MAEMVLKARALPEPLYRLVTTEEVVVRKQDDEIRLIPVKVVSDTKSSCPFLGFYSDGLLTVEGYLARKRKDKELES